MVSKILTCRSSIIGWMVVAFTEMEKIEEDRVWVKSRVSFGNVKFEVPLCYPHGNLRKQLEM